MRLYISPEVLNRLNGNIPDVCIKCETHKGTLFHCLWSCSKFQEFWREVVETLSNTSEVTLPMCPRMCILRLIPKDFNLSRANSKMVTLCLLQARRTIAKCWKSIQRPTTKGWLEDIVQVIAMEELTYSLKGKYALFEEMWTSLLDFVKGPQFLRALKWPYHLYPFTTIGQPMATAPFASVPMSVPSWFECFLKCISDSVWLHVSCVYGICNVLSHERGNKNPINIFGNKQTKNPHTCCFCFLFTVVAVNHVATRVCFCLESPLKAALLWEHKCCNKWHISSACSHHI